MLKMGVRGEGGEQAAIDIVMHHGSREERGKSLTRTKSQTHFPSLGYFDPFLIWGVQFCGQEYFSKIYPPLRFGN